MTWRARIVASPLVRSALVGGVATGVDVAVLFGLVDGLAWTPVAANLPALAAGVAVQFAGNKWFAFRDRSRDYLKQGALFAAVEAGTFAFNALAFHGLVTLLAFPYAAARVVGTLTVYLSFSYPLWARIFRPGAPGGRGRTARQHSRPATRAAMRYSPNFGRRM